MSELLCSMTLLISIEGPTLLNYMFRRHLISRPLKENWNLKSGDLLNRSKSVLFLQIWKSSGSIWVCFVSPQLQRVMPSRRRHCQAFWDKTSQWLGLWKKHLNDLDLDFEKHNNDLDTSLAFSKSFIRPVLVSLQMERITRDERMGLSSCVHCARILGSHSFWFAQNFLAMVKSDLICHKCSNNLCLV